MIETSRLLRPAFLLVVALLAACSTQGDRPRPESSGEAEPPPEGTVIIEAEDGTVEVAVQIADTPEEQTRGLMGRTELDADAGMVFLVEEPLLTSFWMKDTLIPLSIAFWDQKGRIHTILNMDPCSTDSCPSYFPSQPWSGALEVNQGFFTDRGVKIGDRARVER